MEEYQVVWTEPAVADLEAISAFLEQASPSAAEKIRAEIVEHVEILRSFPLIGPRYPRDRRGLTREIVCRKYRIFYRVVEEAKRVEVLTIWHGSRREPPSLP
jgi:toxin ParE1/3/4